MAPLSTHAERRATHAGDRYFRIVVTAAAGLILLALGGVVAFLVTEAAPALTSSELGEEAPGGLLGYLGPLVFGTVLVAGLALVIAGPLAVAVGLFASHYAPRRIRSVAGPLVDLLAAVPSVVYGLWGIFFLAPLLVPAYRVLGDALGFLPFFAGPVSTTGRTVLTAGVVLALMVLPISTSLCREVFCQTPTAHQEAALALGATKSEMVRLAVLPPARAGIASALLLGLGRALGETMAVAMVLSATGTVTWDLIGSSNPSTIAANIALMFPEASGIEVNLLIASGLVLFCLTLVVNLLSRSLVRRGAHGGAAA